MNLMNSVITLVVAVVILAIVWKLLKGFFKFAIIIAVLALIAYYFTQ